MSKKLGLATALVISIIIIGVMILNREETPTETQIPTVGLVLPTDYVTVFLQSQLTELGYVDGENIQYITVVVEDPQEYEDAIKSLLERDVDIIACMGASAALVASELTTTTPIIFMSDQEQFSLDILPRMQAQGSDTNLTGIITANPAKKRLELLMEIDPSVEVVYVPYDPNIPLSIETLSLLEEAAVDYDVAVENYEFSDEAGIQQALQEMPSEVDAIFLGEELPALISMGAWANFSIERQVPLVVSLGQFNEGLLLPQVLMGYGAGIQEIYQQAAELIDQLLKGVTPDSLPPRPSDVYLTLSLGAATALGIEIPDDVLSQASQIIREEVPLPISEALSEMLSETASACNATLTSPLGENTVCVSTSCDLLVDRNFATFSEKVAATSCSPENVQGVCTTNGVSVTFYSGSLAAVESGCISNGGEWQTAAE